MPADCGGVGALLLIPAGVAPLPAIRCGGAVEARCAADTGGLVNGRVCGRTCPLPGPAGTTMAAGGTAPATPGPV
jgi:hypothetical protein